MTATERGDEADRERERTVPESETEVEPEQYPESDVNEGSPLSETWYRSPIGVGAVAFDVLLTLVLAYVTTREWNGAFEGLDDVPIGVIPWYVYVFSVLGALGYVFTTLVDDFDRETSKLLWYNLRLPAALPLGGGVFLLSDVMLEDLSQAGPLVVGTAFLAGLYVNLAYERLGALAERLL